MERLMIALTLLSCRSAAIYQDLTGMMAIFPEDSTDNFAKLLPKKEGPFKALSVCLKFDTDDPGKFSLFSMATPRESDAFVILKKGASGPFKVVVNDKEQQFHKVPQSPLSWTNLCTTWDSSTGLIQLWVDGQPSVKKMASKGTPIQEKPIIILGQEQDSYGSRFDRDQTFMGHITNLHVWDRVLQPCEVEQITEGQMSQPGNVLNWGALEIEITGNVVLESSLSTNATAHVGPCLPPGE
ncbi:serum amyloid P-component-like [Megalops cyprinoides]|uniref:serum amyloid P-component-like n=1 Tax=Megalops cyprinoides TaxID=118141 RepID=UPI001865246C|nr:serum amyloid P-component-like [Megalops cyprinoides]